MEICELPCRLGDHFAGFAHAEPLFGVRWLAPFSHRLHEFVLNTFSFCTPGTLLEPNHANPSIPWRLLKSLSLDADGALDRMTLGDLRNRLGKTFELRRLGKVHGNSFPEGDLEGVLSIDNVLEALQDLSFGLPAHKRRKM